MKKVLIIQHKMIGDVLTSSILCEALKRYDPMTKVHYLVNSATIPILHNNPYIDEIVEFKAVHEKNPISFLKFTHRLRSKGFDAVIDVYSKPMSAMMVQLLNAKRTIGYQKWYTTLYSNTFKYLQKTKTTAGLAIENRILLLSPLLENLPKDIKPKIFLSKSEIEEAKAYLLKSKISLSKPLYMISVLGSSENKTYPLNYMAQLLDMIIEEIDDAQLIFNYIPKQKQQVDQLYSLCSPHTKKKIFIDVFGTSLRSFLGLCHWSDAVIGNEGGAINMAKALEVPTFAIFSPWISKRAWGLFESEANVALHIKDVLPYLTESSKDLKKKYHTFYKQFKPTLIRDKLKDFLLKTKTKI